MTAPSDRRSTAGTTWCRRLQRELPTAEHERCPYCFGDAEAVRGGRHETFCGFDPGRDPIQFGFPPDTSRNLES